MATGTLEIDIKGVSVDAEVTVTVESALLLSPRWLVAAPRASGQLGLSWRYETDPARVGYNLYRSLISGGGYAKITPTPITNTSYVDTGLSNGQTYYYVVTAVASDGSESSPSKEAKGTATSDSTRFGVALSINVGESMDPRVGDLTGDGYNDFLFRKWDDLMKAFNYKGELLWEINFMPDGTYSHGKIHYDFSAEMTPTAIWDIDNDGKNEVICQYVEGGFPYSEETWYLSILDGATGAIKRRVELPSRLLRLSIANFRGLPHPQDIVAHFGLGTGGWLRAYTHELQPLWSNDITEVNAAYPKSGDIDGDGHDELVLGHRIIDHDGSLLMNLPYARSGHADSIIISDFGLGGNKLILIAEEVGAAVPHLEGLYMFDPITRTVLWEFPHEITLSYHEIDIGNVRDDYPGYEIEVTRDDNGDRNVPVYLLSSLDGHLIWRRTNITDTEESKIICWRGGDTMEVIGQQGIFDGYGNKVAGSNRWALWLGDAIGDYREEYFRWSEGVLYVFTNPEFNPNVRRSIWETDPERVKEEYVNFSFY